MASEVKWSNLSKYKRDYYGGALMMLIGIAAAVHGTKYEVGSLTAMGAGFFPVSLGIILAILGLTIAGTARRRQASGTGPEDVCGRQGGAEWRGWLCIVSGIVAFLVLGRWGGLLPASFAITFISAMGDRDNSWVSALILAAIITAIAFVVFWWILQLQFPLFNWS